MTLTGPRYPTVNTHVMVSLHMTDNPYSQTLRRPIYNFHDLLTQKWRHHPMALQSKRGPLWTSPVLKPSPSLHCSSLPKALLLAYQSYTRRLLSEQMYHQPEMMIHHLSLDFPGDRHKIHSHPLVSSLSLPLPLDLF